jgi:hypothetical protein
MYWALTGAALLLAAFALARARAAARCCERLTDSYWELRYEYGQLRARLARLEGGAEADVTATVETARAAPATFIPLSSLKR